MTADRTTLGGINLTDRISVVELAVFVESFLHIQNSDDLE